MKFLKFLFAFVLLPLVWAQGWALLDLVTQWILAAPWRAVWFWSTLGGAAVWTGIFFLLPRPVWFYVLGHELTHALAVWMAGGKIYSMQVGSGGGHVATDKVNWWISLSPYFVPLYTLIWLGLWVSVDFYYSLDAWHPLLFFGVGLTYAFHVTFTLTMLHPQQTDLSGEGYFFSGVVILAMNLLIITALLLMVSEDVTWGFVVQSFIEHAAESYAGIWRTILELAGLIKRLMMNLFAHRT